jgi:uncharacterized protein
MARRSERVIIDTGSLVALLNKNDQYHEWANRQLASLTMPFTTCDAVMVEAWYLLRTEPHLQEKLLRLFTERRIIISFDLSAEIDNVVALIQRYSNVKMSVADGCLVRMSELQVDCLVFSTDTDFNIYRRHGDQIIPALLPPST